MQSLTLLLPICLPFLMAVPCYFVSARNQKAGYGLMLATAFAVLFSCASFWFVHPTPLMLEIKGFSGLGLSLKADGFRSLYATIAAFMWLGASLFTPAYFNHGSHRGRYCLFSLLTLGATVGVFLSDDLFTAFLFFEIMSFTSYPLVAHEETGAAMRAAETYLAIAVLGGMAMLMGLIMLSPLLGSLSFDTLYEAAARLPQKTQLYLPSALIVLGFGAKAGMFPLHVWLPKAHPVAPAPASALLSGVLTKVGVFGVLVIATRVLYHDQLFGQVMLVLGLITMVAGALLALLSIDLKRTLACSSMSQIGFILVGVSMQCLLGEHNALAAQGTVLHMVNHSLIKLTLFLSAGAVYLSTHSLNLNDVCGFGRNKPFLHLCFLIGAASISGIPGFSGYISKTLLHESIVEYIDHLAHLHIGNTAYLVAEWLFILTGGITFGYMLKLYIAIFWEKPIGTPVYPLGKVRYLSPLACAALVLAALPLFLMGILPDRIMTPLANLSLPFLLAHPPEHAVDYFSAVNLLGGGKSLLLGLATYLSIVRPLLMKKQPSGQRLYVDRKPLWLDLEDYVYRPMLKLLDRLTRVPVLFCANLLDRLIQFVSVHLPPLMQTLEEAHFLQRIMLALEGQIKNLSSCLKRCALWLFHLPARLKKVLQTTRHRCIQDYQRLDRQIKAWVAQLLRPFK